ncbi:hypothetical protein DERF_001927 [Dermatophagoides farinae]|uniref:Uncharacterized protein n=1 Tax=Dermatophagoides farinae TaxID=6954 RepID=A0A922IBX1_DERFA|nr:hypothetical protein DERF_001927 [Dermatophagoides farinae]
MYCLKNESFYIGCAYPETFKELESLDSFSGIDHDVAENLEVFDVQVCESFTNLVTPYFSLQLPLFLWNSAHSFIQWGCSSVVVAFALHQINQFPAVYLQRSEEEA